MSVLAGVLGLLLGLAVFLLISEARRCDRLERLAVRAGTGLINTGKVGPDAADELRQIARSVYE